MSKPCKTVLLTGGSSGIGAATAKILCRAGMTVYAASRHGTIPEDDKTGATPDVSANGRIIPVKMDVNKAEDIASVLQKILQEQTTLDAIVCNAGNGLAGAIEDTSEEEARYQFETCFFGTLKSIQACLPVFRKQRYGRIITLSSVAALVPIPYQTLYSSVKASIRIFTQALSLETKSFGIQCCSILPGDTKTGFTKARKYTKQSQNQDSTYFRKMSASVFKMEKDEQNGMSPDVIGKAILKQLKRKRMKASVTPRIEYKLFCFLAKILPEKVMLWIVGLLY